MKKTLKFLAVIAAIGAAIGAVIAFLYKNCNDKDTFDLDLDDEDFDLDSDLQAVDREYVPLKKSVSETPEEKKETNETADSSENEAADAEEKAIENKLKASAEGSAQA